MLIAFLDFFCVCAWLESGIKVSINGKAAFYVYNFPWRSVKILDLVLGSFGLVFTFSILSRIRLLFQQQQTGRVLFEQHLRVGLNTPLWQRSSLQCENSLVKSLSDWGLFFASKQFQWFTTPNVLQTDLCDCTNTALTMFACPLSWRCVLQLVLQIDIASRVLFKTEILLIFWA